MKKSVPSIKICLSFSGVPLLECCHVHDTLSEPTVVGLPPGWVVLVLDNCTSASIPLCQVVHGRPWCLRHTNDLVMVVFEICLCHTLRETELTPL